MPSPRLFRQRVTWAVVLLVLVAVYGVGSVKPQKNIDKKNNKVTNPQALAHMNVNAKFGPRAPSFEASGSTKGNGTRQAKGQATWVRSSLSQLNVGNSPLNVTEMNWSVKSSNVTGDGSQTYVYSAALDANTSVEHTYGFHAVAAQGDFSGLAFNISESAIKWSINLTSAASRSEGITLRYTLADNKSYTATSDNVTTFYNAPRDNMTTYVLPLTATSSSSLAFAEVQVFDVALVDGELQAIRHYVEAVPLASEAHQYVLVLEFPPFNRSLYYDPSLSLGVLVGDQTGSGSGGGDDNTALIVAVSVVVVVAVVVVVVAAVGGVIYGYRRKRHHKKRMNQVRKTMNKESQLASERV